MRMSKCELKCLCKCGCVVMCVDVRKVEKNERGRVRDD
jgi:hypothetical protein